MCTKNDAKIGVECSASTPGPHSAAPRSKAQTRQVAPKTASASSGTLKFLKLQFQPSGKEAFTLHVFHDPVDKDPARATLFILREAWQVLAKESVSESGFKKQSAKIIKVEGFATATTTPEQFALCKGVLIETGVCGARSKALSVVTPYSLGAFLRHNGLGAIATVVDISLPSALAAAQLAQGTQDGQEAAQITMTTVAGAKPTGPRRYGLVNSDITPELAAEFDALKNFWTCAREIKRGSCKPIKEAVFGQRLSLIKQFLGYCALVHGLEPKLELYKRVPLLQAYLEWMVTRRAESDMLKGGEATATSGSGLNPTARSAVQYTATAVMVGKWLERDNPNKGHRFKKVEYIEDYRVMESQSFAEADLLKEKDCDSDATWVSIDEIDGCWGVLEKLALSKPPDAWAAKLKWAISFKRFILISMWTRAPPVRSQVVRKLKLSNIKSKSQENQIYWDENKNSYMMCFPHHKTAGGKKAKKKTDSVALPSELNPHIETYVREALPVLLKAANCPTQLAKFGSEATTNLLPNANGEQYSASCFSAWVQRMWKDLTGKPMNAHKIRSIMVTDLYNRSTTLQTRQAYASSMGQTMGTQENIYCKQNRTDMCAPAINDMNEQIKARALARANKSKAAPASTRTTLIAPTGGLALTSANSMPPSLPLGSWLVEKVLEATTDKQGGLKQALIQWGPTWEPKKMLTPAVLNEAEKMLPPKKRFKASSI